MLVDACSNIGQELTKTGKSSDVTGQFEVRKLRSTASPSSNEGSKPNSPPPYGQQRIIGSSALPLRPKNELPASKEQLSAAASLASQYQLMYQQLLYQTELEYLQKSKGASAGPTPQPKTPQDLAKAMSCSLCRINPSYTGYCVHDNSLNQMLAMLNPGSAAAAMLAYSSKLASFQQPYADAPLSALHPVAQNGDSTNTSPAANQSVDSRRTSASSVSSNSPRRHISPQQTNTEQPMNLHIEKSKSPLTSTKLIECHWVGAEGYCGKRFHSSDDLMQHLKHHVATCPNVVVSAEEETKPNSPGRQQITKASPIDRSSYKHRTSATTPSNLLTIGTKHHASRYQPYSTSDRMFPNALLLANSR